MERLYLRFAGRGLSRGGLDDIQAFIATATTGHFASARALPSKQPKLTCKRPKKPKQTRADPRDPRDSRDSRDFKELAHPPYRPSALFAHLPPWAQPRSASFKPTSNCKQAGKQADKQEAKHSSIFLDTPRYSLSLSLSLTHTFAITHTRQQDHCSTIQARLPINASSHHPHTSSYVSHTRLDHHRPLVLIL